MGPIAAGSSVPLESFAVSKFLACSSSVSATVSEGALANDVKCSQLRYNLL